MILGRVTGEVHSTIHHPYFQGHKLLVVTRISPSGEPGSDYLIAIDTVGAGVGEDVLVLDEGNGARQVLASTTAPVRSVVVGIIDSIDVQPDGGVRPSRS
jgi:ethanolamine utilization protein EutN